MNEIEKTTRRMSSFNSVDEIMEWLRYHECGNSRDEVQRAWDARQRSLGNKYEINYRMMVERRLGKKNVIIEKQTDERR